VAVTAECVTSGAVMAEVYPSGRRAERPVASDISPAWESPVDGTRATRPALSLRDPAALRDDRATRGLGCPGRPAYGCGAPHLEIIKTRDSQRRAGRVPLPIQSDSCQFGADMTSPVWTPGEGSATESLIPRRLPGTEDQLLWTRNFGMVIFPPVSFGKI
jgi:hypothetical protein